jgi:hypothetical protein
LLFYRLAEQAVQLQPVLNRDLKGENIVSAA